MADVISRLRLESGEFDSKIKRAGQELLAYSEHCRKMGLEMGYANRDAKEFAKALGSMQTVSQTARGKINELSEAFVNAKVMYKNMTDEEKKGEFGKNLAASLDQLKSRLNSAKQDLADVNKELSGGGKFGEFGSVLDTLGSKLGVTGNLTEMLTSKTALLTGAVGAGIAVVTKATEAWASYNAELAKQDQITQVTTGLKGEDADRMTDKMRALSDTYNVDFREAVNAANTLMTQFGKTGDEATQLIKDGMRGMIQGDGPKLLSMIQQYAPAFRDAGVSASQLVAVIQNSEGGIFTDQNMNAIVMGIKNIRLMTKATSDALAQLGIDGEKMSKQLSDGSMTVFDALKQVAAAVQNVNSNSQAAGEVMQQVFGRQGAMAGTKLGEAIATLNTNLEETKRQTGEVGDALAELQTANERLNTAIREAFSYDGWDQMAQGIRSKLITALADVISMLGTIRGWFNSIEDDVRKGLGQTVSRNGGAGFGGGGGGGGIRGNNNPAPPPPSRPGGGNKTTTKNGIKDEFTEMEELVGLIPVAEQKVKDLQQQIRESWDEGEIAKLTKELKVAEDEVKRLKDIGKPVDLEKLFSDVGVSGGSGMTRGQEIEQSIRIKLSEQNIESDMQTLRTLLETQIKNGIEGIDIPTDMLMQAIIGEGLNIPDEYWKNLQEQINEKLKEMGLDQLDIDFKTGESKKKDKKEKSPIEGSKQLVSGLSQVADGLQQMGVKLPEEVQQVLGVVQGLMTVIEGVNTIIGITQTAALTANTTAMVALTSALWANTAASIIPFAGGGIVPTFANGGLIWKAAGGMLIPGNSFSGDNLRLPVDGGRGLIGVNSGELILSRAQQGNLASQLNGGGTQNIQLEAVISGEQILLVQNNRGRRTGKGEIVQSNKRRQTWDGQ